MSQRSRTTDGSKATKTNKSTSKSTSKGSKAGNAQKSKKSSSPSDDVQKSSVLPIFINWLSAVTCVLANKFVLKDWKHSTFLTAVHFTFTFLAILVLLSIGFNGFTYKRLSLAKVFPLSILLCASIGFNNLSIQFNPIAFYQVMKIAVTPTVAFIEVVFLKRKLSLFFVLSLLIMLIGIVLMSLDSFLKKDDKSYTVGGLIVGLVGTISTALYQILPKQLQLKEECSEYQLLLFQSPISAILLFALVPLEGFLQKDNTSLFELSQYNRNLLIGIGVTTFMAAFINCSIAIIIKRTSALTYNVVSHLKTVSILVGGVLFFHEKVNIVQFIGIVLALAGILWYSYLDFKAKAAKAAAETKAKSKGGK